jgi:hypothetical protein
MNYRLSTLFSTKAYATDATEVIDINVADPISQLVIELKALGHSNTATAHAVACLKKIEIVDGSDVLFSLTGYEADAVDIYHNKGMRSNWNSYLDDNYCDRYIGINFGRRLWDPVLAFDPKKFRNPQLKISLDPDAGGCACDENQIKIVAAMFDEKIISPIGFLMHKEIKDYPMASATHEYTDLPTDHPYRKLLIRQMTVAAEPCQVIENVKLSEDQDKRIIFDHPATDLLRVLAANNPPLIEQIMFWITTALTSVFTTASERATATMIRWEDTLGSAHFASGGSAGGRMRAIGDAAGPVVAIMSGWTPHGVYELPFGDQDDIEDWFDVTRVGSLKLDIKAFSGRTSADTVQIFLQQLRKY